MFLFISAGGPWFHLCLIMISKYPYNIDFFSSSSWALGDSHWTSCTLRNILHEDSMWWKLIFLESNGVHEVIALFKLCKLGGLWSSLEYFKGSLFNASKIPSLFPLWLNSYWPYRFSENGKYPKGLTKYLRPLEKWKPRGQDELIPGRGFT